MDRQEVAMTAATPSTRSTPARAREAAAMIAIDNASWELYELLLREVEGQNVRITYDQGRMVLMSPLPIHEKVKKLAGRLIELATLERDIPVSSFGSTTWKRQDLAKGLEPDECYYIQNEPAVHGRADIDLDRDPPPDLAVEVDITHNPLDRPSIYAALGVQELWRYDGVRFTFVHRTAAGRYEPIAMSEALPFMTPEVVDRFVALALADENGGLRAFRDWLRAGPPRPT
jgi:Uma2 family endonuclease